MKVYGETARARAHRRDMTFAEKALWRELRRHPLAGSHWRKQAPIGPFIVDFSSRAAKIIVEVDGRIHRVDAVAAADIERQTWLEGRGYLVLRFTNEDVLSDVGGVIRAILSAHAAHTPTPNPSPQGGGEEP
ncbi:MAG: endonuclease domain-containing protein [Hyphomonadaceae bacterium]